MKCVQSRSGTAALLVAPVLLLASQAAASHIMTPVELRDACVNSPGHVVILDHATKVSLPSPGPATPLLVPSGCTLLLGANAKLETEFVEFSFDGPLAIQSVEKTEVKLVKTHFRAPSVSINLTGFNSAFGNSESTLEATAGNMIFAFGAGAKLEMINRLIPGPQYGLSATGSIQISAFGNFTGLIDENFIRADHGFSIAMSQSFGLLKMTQLVLDVPAGSIEITSSPIGEKAQLEVSECSLRASDGILVQLGGRESPSI